MNRGLLNQATSADHEPVPGFALVSIAVCKQLEEYLMNKLAKDHSGVKLKVLKIVRYVCENDGLGDFRRLVQRRADVIREAQSYRGTPDPLRGDAPNKAVRDEAAATLKSLFAMENTGQFGSRSSTNPQHQTLQSRIQGMGSGVTPVEPIRFESSAPRRMESMGNPYFSNHAPPASSTISDSLTSIYNSENPGREIISSLTSGVQSVVDRLGGRSTPPPTTTTTYIPSPSSQWVPPPVPVIAGSLQTPTVQSALNELCLGGRVSPTPQAISTFLAKAEQIEGIELGDALAGRLGDVTLSWTQKIKLLAGVEALHRADLDVATATITERHPECILNLFTSTSVQCAGKAKEVAVLLGLVQRTATRADVVQDLLDFGDSPIVSGPEISARAASPDLLDLGGDDAPSLSCPTTSVPPVTTDSLI